MISRGKFRYLKMVCSEAAMFSSTRFKVTLKNKKYWEHVMGEPLRVGEVLVMKPRRMSSELLRLLG